MASGNTRKLGTGGYIVTPPVVKLKVVSTLLVETQTNNHWDERRSAN